MEIKKEVAAAIEATLNNRRKDETFERALGKSIRKRRLSFSDYVGAISGIRERAKRGGVSLEEAAGQIISEETGKKGNDKKD